MYPTVIADQLPRHCHDVEAVTARQGLRSLSDADLFVAAQTERRALVAENGGDFSAIVDAADQRGRRHHSLTLVDPAKYPRSDRRTIGRMVRRLYSPRGQQPRDESTGMRYRL
jgi:hypothetical protein